MKELSYYPFVEWATESSIKISIVDNPKKFITERMNTSIYNFGVSNILDSGKYKLLGWMYDFRPYLKKYVYKQHGQWHEAWALNKTNLKKLVYGRIDNIIEIGHL